MISKKNKKKFFIFSILCFLIFIFFWLNINSIFSTSTKDFISSFYNYHFSYKLDQEDDNEKYNALQIENTKLRNLLDIKNNNQELNIIFSKVIFKYPSILNNTFFVPLGEKDGVQKNQLVFSDKKFVGKVGNVNESHSEIYSIQNLNFVMIVEVGEEKHKGILKGDGFSSYIKYIQDTTNISIGDKVYLQNSIEAKLFLKPIAEVIKIEEKKGFLKIYISSDIFSSNFEYVGIVVNKND